jgi:hypothetical protein
MEVGQSTASANKGDMGVYNKDAVPTLCGLHWDSSVVLERS